MTQYLNLKNTIMNFMIIVTCYVLAFGLTTYLVTPIQGYFLPEITLFASLVYLPHGVRILATWYWGWKAIVALFVANLVSTAIFYSDSWAQFLGQTRLESGLIGASCAFLAFELVRGAGFNLYAGPRKHIHWKALLAIGIIASLINSIGQSINYAGLIVPEDIVPVFGIYLVGDVVGQLVCMLALMMLFRRIRLAGA